MANGPYNRRPWQDENRVNMDASLDANPRIHRTPQTYSFLRQFDVMCGARRLDTSHFSMADYRRIEQPVYGMQTTRATRNTYRLAPSPMDVFSVAYPSEGASQNPGQNQNVSPVTNYVQQAFSNVWRAR